MKDDHVVIVSGLNLTSWCAVGGGMAGLAETGNGSSLPSQVVGSSTDSASSAEADWSSLEYPDLRSGVGAGVFTAQTPSSLVTAEVKVHNVLPLALKIVCGTLMVVMLIVSIAGNTIVCLIVYRKPAMRSAINILLANMALSNILLALLCLPFAFVTLVLDDWIFGTVMCKEISFLHALFVSEAVCILLTISMDRCLIIVWRKDTLTPVRAKRVMVVSWCLATVISFPPTVGWGMYHYYAGWIQCTLEEYRSDADIVYIVFFFSLVFYIPMLVMGYAYACILKTVRRNSHKVHMQPQSLAMVQAAARIGLTMTVPPWKSADVTSKTRAFKTILILFLIYVICWLPYAVGFIPWNFKRTMEDHHVTGTIVLWLGYMNCTLNPIVYCWRIQKFREACADLFPKSLHFLPHLPKSTKRKINPGAAYECNSVPGVEHQTSV